MNHFLPIMYFSTTYSYDYDSSFYYASDAKVSLSTKHLPIQDYYYDCNSTLIQKDSLYHVECTLLTLSEKLLFFLK